MTNRNVDSYTATEELQAIYGILEELKATRECLTAIAEKLEAIPKQPEPISWRTESCGDCTDDDCRCCPWAEPES